MDFAYTCNTHNGTTGPWLWDPDQELHQCTFLMITDLAVARIDLTTRKTGQESVTLRPLYENLFGTGILRGPHLTLCVSEPSSLRQCFVD